MNGSIQPPRITPITEDAWSDILSVQAEAYSAVTPEALHVLQAKWQRSPQHCYVCRDPEDRVSAYLLSHAWHDEIPPKLHQPLPIEQGGDVLFLHDLAVSPRLGGRGVGRALVTRLLHDAREGGYRAALLVSIQASEGFWGSFGFRGVSTAACRSYGQDARIMSMAIG